MIDDILGGFELPHGKSLRGASSIGLLKACKYLKDKVKYHSGNYVDKERFLQMPGVRVTETTAKRGHVLITGTMNGGWFAMITRIRCPFLSSREEK